MFRLEEIEGAAGAAMLWVSEFVERLIGHGWQRWFSGVDEFVFGESFAVGFGGRVEAGPVR